MQGEFNRMIPAVVRLRNQLRNQRMRRMTVVTDRSAVVARFLPRIEMLAHNVTVGALIGVVPEVGEAFGAYGECVGEPDEVEAAIARCLAAVDAGQAAVLNVQIGLQ